MASHIKEKYLIGVSHIFRELAIVIMIQHGGLQIDMFL